jgi:hypothetical protein
MKDSISMAIKWKMVHHYKSGSGKTGKGIREYPNCDDQLKMG